jgi:hypothetical protein
MLTGLLVIIAAIALFFIAWLWFAQGRMIFYPTRELEVTPDEAGLPNYRDVMIAKASGQRIHAWYIEPNTGDSASRRTVLFCHGNGGNISHRLETARFLTELGAPVLLFDYRGYGRSDGSPNERNCYQDARTAFDWLVEQRRLSPDKIVVFGRSLGGAVAVELATGVECGGLIVESALTSTADMGRRMFFGLPVGWLARYKFDALSSIGDINCPVLVTHSPEDDVVPYEMGERLFEAAPEPKRFVQLRGGHNDRLYFEDRDYVEAVTTMLTP